MLVCILTSFHIILFDKKDSVELSNKVRNSKGKGGLALGYFCVQNISLMV